MQKLLQLSGGFTDISARGQVLCYSILTRIRECRGKAKEIKTEFWPVKTCVDQIFAAKMVSEQSNEWYKAHHWTEVVRKLSLSPNSLWSILMSWHKMMNSVGAEGRVMVNVNSGSWCHADSMVMCKIAHSLSPWCVAIGFIVWKSITDTMPTKELCGLNVGHQKARFYWRHDISKLV